MLIPKWNFRSFKICMCLERIDKIGEAITYCTEAIRDSARRLEKLDAKLSTFSGWGWSLDDIAASCNGPVDPAYLELQAEKKRVHELQGKFENKASIHSSFWSSFCLHLECTVVEIFFLICRCSSCIWNVFKELLLRKQADKNPLATTSVLL